MRWRRALSPFEEKHQECNRDTSAIHRTSSEAFNKALEKERDLRFQSASEMRADLKRLRRDTDSGRISSSENRVVQESAAEPRLQL